jgi:type I restriction enzyme S subunit
VKPIDVAPGDLDTVLALLAKHVPDREVRVFGSRATQKAKRFSDLDLAVMGDDPLPPATLTELKDDFDESALPFKVDVVEWASTPARFREVIRRQSVCLTRGRPRRTQVARDREEGSRGS